MTKFSTISKQQGLFMFRGYSYLGLDPLESCFLPICIAFVIVALTPKCLVKTDEMVLVSYSFLSWLLSSVDSSRLCTITLQRLLLLSFSSFRKVDITSEVVYY